MEDLHRAGQLHIYKPTAKSYPYAASACSASEVPVFLPGCRSRAALLENFHCNHRNPQHRQNNSRGPVQDLRRGFIRKFSR